MANANEGVPGARGGVAGFWRPGDIQPVEAFLHLLARAVRQFHTYPPTSPLCVAALESCHQALWSGEGVETFTLRVTSRDLLLDEAAIGAGTIIEQELTRRLHRARVAGLDVSRRASKRDLSRFCTDLIGASDATDPSVSLAELLDEHGVQALAPRMAERTAVLDLGMPEPARRELVAHERARRERGEAGRPIYLYPPGRGWVRMDPAADLGPVSLVDLAVLAEDPHALAGMLLRLADDEAAGEAGPHSALEKKYGEVAALFSALEPRLARMMFGRLARAVLDLEPERRQALLRGTILPGLFDGTVDAMVLQHFPDPDLAESLCLLLDLETAAPNVLTAALDRLELAPERRDAMVPLLEAQVQVRQDATAAASLKRDASVDTYGRKLLHIDLTGGRRYEDFTAFDLSIDESTADTINRIACEAGSEDTVVAQLDCLSNLVHLEPNPDAVSRFLGRTHGLLTALEQQGRVRDIASWLARQRHMADALRLKRPDVADAIVAGIAAFCTRERTLRLVQLYEAGGESRHLADALFEGYGAAVVPSFLALLDDPAHHALHRVLVQRMCEHSRQLAPALAARGGGVGDGAARALVAVFGCAGAGYETLIAEQLRGRDEQTIRDGLRALTQIGTAQAAGFVAAHLDHASPRVRAAAEEALSRFSAGRIQLPLRELLSKRDFVTRNPAVAARLLERVGRAGAEGMENTLAALAPLRFRVWNPPLARVGREARKLVKR